ncbi:23339_t:CDS:2 [Cetraspora pellucida]|uniref:23339_t:CDS:1 n=1 Tax=Cetraspora pellucida TaxID=1433469 RepID=A0A9N9EJL3_9GLOM|nr:23339_t:CDS:2 [Cetraspora pellucida]
MLNKINTRIALVSGNKLGSIPSNRYSLSRTELENQLACANQDQEIAIEYGNQLANKCSVLDKDNKHIQQDLNQSNKDKKKLFKHIYQLTDKVKQLYLELDTPTSQITHKNISLNKYKNKIHTKLKEIKAFQSKIKALEMRLSSTQKDSSMKEFKIDYLRVELSALNSNLALKNKICFLETRLKELLPCNRLSLEQVKIGDEKNADNISVILEESLLHNKTENSQVDKNI